MKLNCIIDSKNYSSKPSKKEYGAINNRIVQADKQSISIDELADHLKQGRAYLSGHLIDKSRGRKKDNIEAVNFISLDVDNHYLKDGKDIYTNYSVAEVIKELDQLIKAKPFISYKTFTGINKTNNSKRFRLLYSLDRNVNSKEVQLLLKYIVDNTGDIFDSACVDSARIFQATDKEVRAYSNHQEIDTSIIDELKTEQEEQQRELERIRAERKANRKQLGYDTIYSNDATEELKQQNLGDYLRNQGYDVRAYGNSYKTSCPIHNGTNKNNFVVNYKEGAWVYHCFSGCGGAGGTIIDLHMALNNLNKGQAIKELCDMYNIKQTIASDRPSNLSTTASKSYEIDKYISDDKRAVEGIFESLNKHKRILITAPMGTGKTHFTIKDIYSYAKALGKKVVLVIPSVKQLENLNNNKDIPVVYEKMPVYTGSDIVATTPESLPKVIADIGADNYILIADESHERYTSLYRTGYRNKSIETAEITTYKSIHLTATPRLLINDNFDEVINIETKTAIENKIRVFKIKDRLEDNMLSIVKKLVEANRQPILFNNNKEINDLLANQTEVKEKIVVAEFEEGQLNIFKADDPTHKTIEKTIVATETIQSGKKSENVATGHIKADATFTTSSITAGVDLYTRENATLIINTRGVTFDNVIQLIGRFRKGIEVIILVSDKEEKKKYFDLQNAIEQRISDSKEVARIFNNNQAMQRLSESKKGIKESAHLELADSGIWEVNETKVIADVYKEWSEAVYDNTDKLIELLEETTAFKVLDTKVAKFNDENETTMTELKEATKEAKKEILKETSRKLLKLSDDTLSQVICKDYDNLSNEVIEVAKMYHAVAERDIEKIQTAAEKLFTDESGVKDVSSAFKKFYSQSWSSIKREIAEVEAREINRRIKEHGTETYLQVKSLRHKRSSDVVQARIRHELQDIEKKQGRLSNKRFTQLVKALIDENYIFNSKVKAYKDKNAPKEDKEKAFQSVGQDVGKLIRDIYNFDNQGKIQSPKC